MTAPELKPCPFCGGNASISKDHDPDGNGAFYAIKCRKCRAKSPEIYAVETCNIHFAQVRDAWNSRADIAAVQPAQVLVKPLVWTTRSGAPTAFGTYIVTCEDHDSVTVWFVLFNGKPLARCGEHRIEDAAKAAAQADYEANILAALAAAKAVQHG